MGIATPADLLARGLEPPELLQRPLFAYFGQARSESLGQGWRATRTPQPSSSRRKLRRKRPTSLWNSDQPLHAFGVDSLVAVELKNRIAKEFAAEVAMFELMGGRSVAAIGEFVTKTNRVLAGLKQTSDKRDM
ncbi:hypothetical protein DL771_011666 [Monosporascus sp. 5C6A]|nr:hypothetical protein DL771_011666 [Monosporascus sp. 5C6A]